MKKIYVLISLFLIFSCGGDKIEKQLDGISNELSFQNRIQEFEGANIFFRRLGRILTTKDNLWFFDDVNVSLYLTDKNLNLIKEIKFKGQGPEELIQNGNIFYKNDSVYVLDYLGKKIGVLNTHGEYLKSINFNHQILDNNFFVKNALIYLPSSANPRIRKVDFEGNLVETISFEKLSTNEIHRPEYAIFDLNSAILVCYKTFAPFVQIISESGETLNSFDLGTLDIFKGALKKQESLLNAPFPGAVIFSQDIKVIGNNIFLLIGERDNEGESPKYNKILKLPFEPNSFDFGTPQFIELSASNWYTSFEIIPEEKKIIGFNPAEVHIDLYSYK
jgi:hypothetical protein